MTKVVHFFRRAGRRIRVSFRLTGRGRKKTPDRQGAWGSGGALFVLRAFFVDQQLPADDVVPVGLLAFEIELHQVVLRQVAGREAQRPVVVVGGQAQRFRRGGRLTLVVEQGARRSSWISGR